MEPKFSDPAWWPRRLELPKTTSPARLIVGTLVPLIAVVALVVAVLTHGGDSSNGNSGSVVAFETCMAASGAGAAAPGTAGQSAAIANCRELLPAGTHIGRIGSGTAQEQFADCMQDAGDGGRRGRFGHGPSRAFSNALEICRLLVQAPTRDRSPSPPAPASPSRAPIV